MYTICDDFWLSLLNIYLFFFLTLKLGSESFKLFIILFAFSKSPAFFACNAWVVLFILTFNDNGALFVFVLCDVVLVTASTYPSARSSFRFWVLHI